MTTTTTGTAPAAQLATYGRKVIATALEGRYYLADDVLAALHAAGLAIVTAADPETVTTPTTGTAPLIERLVAALRARYGHTKTGRPDLVASAWRDDAYAILEALAPAEVAASDGVTVSENDAREICRYLWMSHEPGSGRLLGVIDAALQASAPATTARDEREGE
jgi:hypothetical protein